MKLFHTGFILLALFFAACQNKSTSQGEDHDHSHEEVSIRMTEYTKDFELFAEAEPMVAGKTGNILAHFTKLSDFSPLTDGRVTASLIIGKKGIRQKLDKPIRPGIYLFQLQPEVSGKGKLIFDIETDLGTSSLTVGDIEVFADEHDAIHHAEEQVQEHPNAISFTKEQSWKIAFATGFPQTESFGEIIKTTARVESAQSEEVILTAKAAGLVQFKNNRLTEGAAVKDGSVLLGISAGTFADNNMNVRYKEASTNFEKAKANYQRKEALAKDQLVSQKDLMDAKAEYENTKAVFENLQKNFNGGGQNIYSTRNGFVKHIFVRNGQYVEAGQALLCITENSNLFLKAEVQQRYAAALPFIKTANIRSLNSGPVYTLEELNGKVVSFAKNVSDESFLIPLTLQVENRSGIIPGSFMELYLKTESKQDALTVPNSSLIEEQGNFSVFVQLTPEAFEKREVETGKSDGLKTEILSGLKSSDRIVTKGGILVKLAAVSNSLDPHAGHVH